MHFLSSVALLSVIGAASAQAGPWGQCGGMSFTGPTSCVSGWTCVALNDWFSHCESASQSSASSVSASVSTTPSSSTNTTTSTVTLPSSTSSTTQLTGSSSFARANGFKFSMDGETKYFAGTNRHNDKYTGREMELLLY